MMLEPFGSMVSILSFSMKPFHLDMGTIDREEEPH